MSALKILCAEGGVPRVEAWCEDLRELVNMELVTCLRQRGAEVGYCEKTSRLWIDFPGLEATSAQGVLDEWMTAMRCSAQGGCS